jgi:Domain of unknown function (DUF4136)
MKTFKYLCAALMLAFTIASCETAVHVEKDDSVNLKNYKTYMWVDTRYNQNDNTARPSSYGDISVRNAANVELRKAGWSEVSRDPDLLVSYDVLVQNNTTRKSDPVYSQSYSRAYYNPRSGRWSTIYYPSQFLGYNNYDVPVKEGTISITLTDANTDKIVWQGWTTDELNYTRITPEEITAGVQNIFSKLDVAAK